MEVVCLPNSTPWLPEAALNHSSTLNAIDVLIRLSGSAT
jgi:hypothetical protein